MKKKKFKELPKEKLKKEEFEKKLDERELLDFVELIEEEFYKENPSEKPE